MKYYSSFEIELSASYGRPSKICSICSGGKARSVSVRTLPTDRSMTTASPASSSSVQDLLHENMQLLERCLILACDHGCHETDNLLGLRKVLGRPQGELEQVFDLQLQGRGDSLKSC